jgi:DNA (cytosine-5)-methyltransferase 1
MNTEKNNTLCIDLFCGGGGLSLGLKMSGFNVCLGIESDPAHYLVYTKNNPDTPVLLKNIQEIRKITPILSLLKIKVKDIDLIAGGPPCQGFSIANKKTRNRDNNKNDLVYDFLRFVEEVKPKAFILENVIGLTSLDDGKLFNDLLEKFEKIDYSVNHFTLDSAQYGVPQHRKRIFISGSLEKEINKPNPSHGDSFKHSFITVKDAIIGDLPKLNPTRGVQIMDYTNEPKSRYQKKMRKQCTKVYDHLTTLNNEIVKRRISYIKPGTSLCRLMRENQLPEDLNVICDHGGVYRRLDPDAPSITLGNFRKAMVIHPYQNRLLSLREAARLQSFPDNYRFPGRISHMQQLIGDAVPPLLAKVVGKKVRKILVE